MQIKYKIVHVCSVPSQRYQPIPIPFSLLASIKLVNKRNRVVLCILLRLIKQFLWSQSTHNLRFMKFIAVANKHFASQNYRKISCDFHVILILGRGFEESRCWSWTSDFSAFHFFTFLFTKLRIRLINCCGASLYCR